MDKNPSIVVRKNPHYIDSLTKGWLVIESGTCVGQFDSEAEANTHCDKLIAEKPEREESGLNRLQELKNEYRTTPKKEIKKRRQLKAEIALRKTQEGQTKEKVKTKQVKKVETTTEVKAKTFHYHKGRRGRCNCSNPHEVQIP